MGLHRAPRHAQLDTADGLALKTTEFESPASAGLSPVLLVVVLLLGGCTVGDGGGDDEQGGALPDEFAEPARPLAIGADDPSTTTTVAGSGRSGGSTTTVRGGSTTSSPNVGGGGAGGVGTTTTLRPFRPVVGVDDRRGDAGLQARPYGDLTVLRLEDDGTRARVSVQMAGTLPSPPAEGEVIGIGVDVFRGDDEESEYQLFAIGNADGWRAGLQEGSDWVDYPGTFELGGNTIVFTVPWSSIGGRRRGSFSAFADWSQARVAVLADASEDRAPDRGTQSFSF